MKILSRIKKLRQVFKSIEVNQKILGVNSNIPQVVYIKQEIRNKSKDKLLENQRQNKVQSYYISSKQEKQKISHGRSVSNINKSLTPNTSIINDKLSISQLKNEKNDSDKKKTSKTIQTKNKLQKILKTKTSVQYQNNFKIEQEKKQKLNQSKSNNKKQKSQPTGNSIVGLTKPKPKKITIKQDKTQPLQEKQIKTQRMQEQKPNLNEKLMKYTNLQKNKMNETIQKTKKTAKKSLHLKNQPQIKMSPPDKQKSKLQIAFMNKLNKELEKSFSFSSEQETQLLSSEKKSNKSVLRSENNFIDMIEKMKKIESSARIIQKFWKKHKQVSKVQQKSRVWSSGKKKIIITQYSSPGMNDVQSPKFMIKPLKLVDLDDFKDAQSIKDHQIDSNQKETVKQQSSFNFNLEARSSSNTNQMTLSGKKIVSDDQIFQSLDNLEMKIMQQIYNESRDINVENSKVQEIMDKEVLEQTVVEEKLSEVQVVQSIDLKKKINDDKINFQQIINQQLSQQNNLIKSQQNYNRNKQQDNLINSQNNYNQNKQQKNLINSQNNYKDSESQWVQKDEQQSFEQSIEVDPETQIHQNITQSIKLCLFQDIEPEKIRIKQDKQQSEKQNQQKQNFDKTCESVENLIIKNIKQMIDDKFKPKISQQSTLMETDKTKFTPQSFQDTIDKPDFNKQYTFVQHDQQLNFETTQPKNSQLSSYVEIDNSKISQQSSNIEIEQDFSDQYLYNSSLELKAQKIKFKKQQISLEQFQKIDDFVQNESQVTQINPFEKNLQKNHQTCQKQECSQKKEEESVKLDCGQSLDEQIKQALDFEEFEDIVDSESFEENPNMQSPEKRIDKEFIDSKENIIKKKEQPINPLLLSIDDPQDLIKFEQSDQKFKFQKDSLDHFPQSPKNSEKKQQMEESILDTIKVESPKSNKKSQKFDNEQIPDEENQIILVSSQAQGFRTNLSFINEFLNRLIDTIKENIQEIIILDQSFEDQGDKQSSFNYLQIQDHLFQMMIEQIDQDNIKILTQVQLDQCISFQQMIFDAFNDSLKQECKYSVKIIKLQNENLDKILQKVKNVIMEQGSFVCGFIPDKINSLFNNQKINLDEKNLIQIREDRLIKMLNNDTIQNWENWNNFCNQKNQIGFEITQSILDDQITQFLYESIQFF